MVPPNYVLFNLAIIPYKNNLKMIGDDMVNSYKVDTNYFRCLCIKGFRASFCWV